MTITISEIRSLRRMLEWEFQNPEKRADKRLGGPHASRRCPQCGEYYNPDQPFQGHRAVAGVSDCVNLLLWDALEAGELVPGDGELAAVLEYSSPPPSNDLNVLTKGRWWVASPANGPGGVTGGLLVDSSFDVTNPGVAVQKTVALQDGEIHHRRHDGTSWSAWKRTDHQVGVPVVDALLYQSTVTTDLEALSHGRYLVTDPTNGPAGEPGPLLVDNGRSTGVAAPALMVATRTDATKSWRRVFNGSTWTGWVELSGGSAPAQLYNSSPPTTDLDLLEAGNWAVASATNGPTTGDFLVRSFFDPAAPLNGWQSITRVSNNNTWERVHNGTAWLPWRALNDDVKMALNFLRVPPTSDLDALGMGRWLVETPTNGPSGAAIPGLVDSSFDPAAPFAAQQRYSSVDGTDRFVRTWTGAAWTAWVDEGSTGQTVSGAYEHDGSNYYLPLLPTTDPGVAGALWSNNGVLSVAAGPAPVFAWSLLPADSFDVSGSEGQQDFTPAALAYTISNDGNQPLSWTATSTDAWISLSPASGVLAAGATVAVTATAVQATLATLPAGTEPATITFAAASVSDITRTATATVVGAPTNRAAVFANNAAQYGLINWAPSTQDYTIRVRTTFTGTDDSPVFGGDIYANIGLIKKSSKELQFWIDGGAYTSDGFVLGTGVYYLLEIEKVGNTITFKKDGVVTGATASSSNTIPTVGFDMRIGAMVNGSANPMEGSIDYIEFIDPADDTRTAVFSMNADNFDNSHPGSTVQNGSNVGGVTFEDV